jgi:hypothetical protein
VVIRFYLDDLEIEEPIGWDNLQLSMKRDEKFHGMQFEASTGTLQFYGAAAVYLENAKQLNGVKANVIFRADIDCDGIVDNLVTGRLNFGRWTKTCGNVCLVTLPVEEEGCRVVFKARYDQKVDVDSIVAFDKVTGLPTYSGLGITMDIPAKALSVGVKGHVDEDSNSVDHHVETFADFKVITRPTYAVVEDNSVDTGQLEPISDAESSVDEFPLPLTPQLLFDDQIECFAGMFNYEFNFSGTFLLSNNVLAAGADLVSAKLKLVTWDGVGTIFTDSTLIDEIDLGVSGTLFPSIGGSFTDQIFTGTIALTEGIGFYGFIEFDITQTGPGAIHLDANTTFSPDTSVNIYAEKLCPPTEARVYLIHELLSRIAEAVTNRCLRAYSEYYGRTDSQPFGFPADGCGGLRVVTGGLLLRQAPDGKLFASPKDMLEGLQGIDNIGFTIEDDPSIPGFFRLRVEELDYFYQDRELLSFDSIPEIGEETQEAQHYSRILMGYKKWEVQNVNGLDEPNSNREYRTSIETLSNTLDATSALVTGSYAIEITRQQSFAKTGAADTGYDNDIFLICVVRQPYGYLVEQNNVSNTSGVYSPQTIMNWRLTPARNMLRWFRSSANSYANFSSSQNKIFFQAGTGNYNAAAELTDPTCKLEAGVLAENQDISVSSFANSDDAIPLWRPEYHTFTYPLSVADYQALKADPWGYISFQCGRGGFDKGFIQEIRFTPAKGTAEFTLKLKW